MKKYEFDLTQPFSDIFFPKERVKTKLQILEILLEATRYMLIAKRAIVRRNSDGMVLLVDKMSRLIFFRKEKFYSIIFPFNVYEYDDTLSFSFQSNMEIDSQFISNVISIIKSDSFTYKCSLDFANPIYDFENEFNDNFWILLKELLLIEDGYIRYDKDEQGYQEAKLRGEEHRHPLNHIDVFYSSKVSFKLGLDKEIDTNEFIDIFDITTDSRYMKSSK